MMDAQTARSMTKDPIKDMKHCKEVMDCVEKAVKLAVSKERFYTSVVCCVSNKICALVVKNLCDLGYLAEWEDHQDWKRINVCWK